MQRKVDLSIDDEPLRLEGALRYPDPSAATAGYAVVAPPHPLYGGSMSNPVVDAMVSALVAVGYVALAFNWRGVEGSEGDVSGDDRHADADYRTALSALPHDCQVVACGYSFGAVAALRAAPADSRISRVIAVAPPPALVERGLVDRLHVPLRVIVGTRDDFAPVESLEGLIAGAPDGCLDVLPGVDHFFSTADLGELAALVRKSCV